MTKIEIIAVYSDDYRTSKSPATATFNMPNMSTTNEVLES